MSLKKVMSQKKALKLQSMKYCWKLIQKIESNEQVEHEKVPNQNEGSKMEGISKPK